MEDSGIDSGDTKPSIVSEEEGLFNAAGSDSSCGSSSSPPRSVSKDVQPIVVVSSCLSGNPSTRQIQRKLEARIEQAKRKHRLQEYKKTSHNLIPIERLPIPGVKEQQQPLVDWETDESEEDIANFFPINRVKEIHKHQELTDTFSIEEMSISGGEDGDEEDDLHLVPPTPLGRRFDCCVGSIFNEKCSIIFKRRTGEILTMILIGRLSSRNRLVTLYEIVKVPTTMPLLINDIVPNSFNQL